VSWERTKPIGHSEYPLVEVTILLLESLPNALAMSRAARAASAPSRC
jgi:hypothetical protein